MVNQKIPTFDDGMVYEQQNRTRPCRPPNPKATDSSESPTSKHPNANADKIENNVATMTRQQAVKWR